MERLEGGKLETVSSRFDPVHIMSLHAEVILFRGHTLSMPAGRITAVCTSCHYKEAVSQK